MCRLACAVVQPRVGGVQPRAAHVQRARRGAARGAEARQQAGHPAALHHLLRPLRLAALLQEPRQVRQVQPRAGQLSNRNNCNIYSFLSNET